MGADTSVVKKKHDMKFNGRGRRVNGKTPGYRRGRGKGDGHQYGQSPRIPEPAPIAWKLT